MACFVCLMVSCFVLLTRDYESNTVSIYSECKLLLNGARISQKTEKLVRDHEDQSHLIQPVAQNISNPGNNMGVIGLHAGKKARRLAEDRTLFESPEFKEYLQLRDEKINSHDFKFLLSGRKICSGQAPILVIMVLSEYFHVEERQTIRNTYGTVVKTQSWPGQDLNVDVKMAFIFGSPETSIAKSTIAAEEDKLYGDVVMVDFKDTYQNLTRKVMMSVKWVSTFCSQAKFMLKVDEDTFVHLGNLMTFLNSVVVPWNGVLIGHGVYRSEVFRSGKWAVSNSTYPFPEFPPYASGNTYVLSGNILSRLFFTAEYLPYLTIEDAFMTGVVREAIGAELLHKVGFTWWEERAPRLCGFHNSVRISGTNCDIDHMNKLWKAIHMKNVRNCYDPTRFEKPVYV